MGGGSEPSPTVHMHQARSLFKDGEERVQRALALASQVTRFGPEPTTIVVLVSSRLPFSSLAH